jgi:acyl-CoA thioesterase
MADTAWERRDDRRRFLIWERVYPPMSDKSAVSAELGQRLQAEPWARALGVEYLEVRRGYCRVALDLQPHMLNFQGTPHGGVIFSLADAAFSAACNSHGEAAVALSMTIEYLASPPPGARLFAEGRERRQGRRAGFYEITVTLASGELIALVHCVAHRTGRAM